MPIQKLTALVLQGYETGNTSEVIRIFTAGLGRLAVMAKGLKRSKRGWTAALQPLNSVEITLSLSEGAEMGTLRDVSLINSRDELRTDLELLALASLLVEAGAESCEVGHHSEELFAATMEALDSLRADDKVHPICAAAYHLMHLVFVAGYEPTIEEELLRPWPLDQSRPVMFWLDVAEARLHANGTQPRQAPLWPLNVEENSPQFPIPPEAMRAVYEFQRGGISMEQMPVLAPAHAEQMLEAFVRIVQWHAGHPMRSARFWRGIRRREA